ncbi:MAG: hypothetical protein IT538_05830, partial [Variibacter sp.]|nr:hypothetical protein [Variibacter sp.]
FTPDTENADLVAADGNDFSATFGDLALVADKQLFHDVILEARLLD